MQKQVAFSFLLGPASLISFPATLLTMRSSATVPAAGKMARSTTIIVACALLATSSAFSPTARNPAHVVPHSSSATILGASSVAESAETATSYTDNADTTNSNASLLLLEDALRPNNVDASQKILNELAQMRQNNQQVEAEQYLDDLLKAIDANTQAIWTRLPTMTRFSRRARLASLARALELSTPPSDDEEENDGAANDAESEGRRRRRALAVLIRTLSKENEEQQSAAGGTSTKGKFARPVIRSIERAARSGAKESATLADMDKRIPAGLETPKYDVLVRNLKSGYEIRQYQPYSLATVGMSSKIKANDASRTKTDRKVSQPTLSGASSFGALAGYLFGKISEQTSMAMTSPVFTTNAGGDSKEGQREMSFVMPSDYWAEDGVTTAPQPLDGSGVTLQRNEGGTRAVVMFGGFASKADIAKRKEQLLKGVEADKDYGVKEGSTVTLAQYNDPFTPGWKRRNEVSIDVVPTTP